MTKPRLLLLDDSIDMGIIVRALGKRSGVEVEHRSSIADAWASLQQRVPDLLLVDMRLTGESGADLCRRVRDTADFGSLRMALFTNWGLHEDLCAGLEAGATFVFAKDLVAQADQWRDRLHEILQWTHGRIWMNLVASHKDGPWPALPRNWPTVYNQVLQQALARRLGAGLFHILVQRAVLQTFARTGSVDPADWLNASGLALNEERLASTADSQTAAHLATSLAEQIWCMLGSRDSAYFLNALSPAIPGLTEALLH